MSTLTDKEWAVLDALAEAHNAFVALPDHHPNDFEEWAADLHRLQHRVMARLAVRAEPEHFTPLEPT